MSSSESNKGETLAGQVALVTGAARGIGAAIASRLAHEGASVAVADIDYQPARETARKITDSTGIEGLALRVDVAREHDAQRAIERTVQRLGRLDIVVNNAGVCFVGPIGGTSRADWERVLRINLTGPFLVSRAAVPVLLRQKSGRIINIASMAAKVGGRHMTAYSASKAGVVAFTRSLARELAPHGITVNSVLPGIVLTELWRRMRRAHARKLGVPLKQVDSHYIRQIPLGRSCKPEDVAGVVAFLAGPDAAYMTGQAINVTGGQEMH